MKVTTIRWKNTSHETMIAVADYLGVSLTSLLQTISYHLPTLLATAAKHEAKIKSGCVPDTYVSGYAGAVRCLLNRDNLQAAARQSCS
jgi:hypothetical protein